MLVIIISGPSGSGKSTLSRNISIELKNSMVLSTDNYYKTGFINRIFSKLIKSYFDKKISFNYKLFNKDINEIINNRKINHIHYYDFKNKSTKTIYKKVRNIKFLIVEGIFTEDYFKNIKGPNYLNIELRTKKKTCLNRVIHRDVNERGKSKDEAIRDFLRSWKVYYRRNKRSYKNKHRIIYSEQYSINTLIKKIINSKF